LRSPDNDLGWHAPILSFALVLLRQGLVYGETANWKY